MKDNGSKFYERYPWVGVFKKTPIKKTEKLKQLGILGWDQTQFF